MVLSEELAIASPLLPNFTLAAGQQLSPQAGQLVRGVSLTGAGRYPTPPNCELFRELC